MLWIESTTTTRGFAGSIVSRMPPRSVSLTNISSFAPSPSRRARSPIWASDSSPEMYSTVPCAWAARSQAWTISVLLPTPGSPPISTSEPGTIPPPSTRSSSSIPTGSRSKSATSISASRTARGAPPGAMARRGRLAVLVAVATRVTRSSRVFHSSQPGQRPAQREDLAPQTRQTNSVRAFAIAIL
jgi:hypothetical protein